MTVDAAIVAKPEGDQQAKVLLVKRKNPPCKVQYIPALYSVPKLNAIHETV